jgi:RimJ/RimL family protein N-acetyltransferase
MIKIETERIYIQNFNDTDLSAFLELANDYMKSDYSKYDHRWPETKEGLLDMLHWLTNNDSFLSVKLMDTQELIGLVTLNKDEQEEITTFNLGYVFNSKYHGNGYAYEACNCYMKYIEGTKNAKVFITGTARENAKSCKLLEKLGFLKMKEERCHFQEDQEGNPIVFDGIIYKKIVNSKK